MLTDEEIQEFLAMLLAFSMVTKASGRNIGELFGVSVKTMARWMRAARHKESVDRLYFSKVGPIQHAITSMNAHNLKYSSYARVAAVIDPKHKVKELQDLMAKAV